MPRAGTYAKPLDESELRRCAGITGLLTQLLCLGIGPKVRDLANTRQGS